METDALLNSIRDGTITRDVALTLSLKQLTARNASGNTPLHAAAKYGRLRDLPPESLQPDFLLLKNDSGYTPLHQTAYGGHILRIG